jgi:hypothetical protein
MLEPTVFVKINRDDYSIVPYEANKEYNINVSDLINKGYSVKTALYSKNPPPIGADTNFARNLPTSSDGSYNYLNWRVINNLYYRNPKSAVESFEGHPNCEKNLYITASIVSFPYMDMGDGVKGGRLFITSSNIEFKDDFQNNLIDVSIPTSSFLDSSYLDAYLGFQELYKYTNYGYAKRAVGNSKFQSNTILDSLDYRFERVDISKGVQVNQTGSGAKIDFNTNSFIEIPHHEELSYEKFEDFTLSFWIKAPISQSNTTFKENSIITKRTYSKIDYSGIHNTLLEDGSFAKRRYTSSSVDFSAAPFYPYDVSIKNQTDINSGKIVFRRSDGLSTLTLTSSTPINDGSFHHVCITKNDSLYSLYIDANLEATGSELKEQSTNANSIIIGAEDRLGTKQFSGSLDELRFYSISATQNQISQSLAENTKGLLYQTNKIGNVYYKRGEIIITSPIENYHSVFNNDNWNLKYKNRYIIYEYETLVRVRKGTLNRTMNPTSTQSPKSNLYLNDFTGSLAPYATTVGLYNKDFKLVAVAKLARPLKMRDDVDINILVRFDY